MAATRPHQIPLSRTVTRRAFLKRVGVTSAGITALTVGAGRGRPAAQPATQYPDWIAASPKPPKRGGVLTRASAWDPPVIDPRHTETDDQRPAAAQKRPARELPLGKDVRD